MRSHPGMKIRMSREEQGIGEPEWASLTDQVTCARIVSMPLGKCFFKAGLRSPNIVPQQHNHLI